MVRIQLRIDPDVLASLDVYIAEVRATARRTGQRLPDRGQVVNDIVRAFLHGRKATTTRSSK